MNVAVAERSSAARRKGAELYARYHPLSTEECFCTFTEQEIASVGGKSGWCVSRRRLAFRAHSRGACAAPCGTGSADARARTHAYARTERERERKRKRRALSLSLSVSLHLHVQKRMPQLCAWRCALKRHLGSTLP